MFALNCCCSGSNLVVHVRIPFRRLSFEISNGMLDVLHFSAEEEKVEVGEPVVGYSVHITGGNFEPRRHRVHHLRSAAESDDYR